MKTRLPLLLVLFAGLVTLAACDALSPGDDAWANANPDPGLAAICGDVTTTDLVHAATGRVRGTVAVWNSEDRLFVRLTASSPVYRLAETALYLGSAPPVPEDVDPTTMTHRVQHPGGTTSYTYTLPLSWAPGTTLYVAAFGRRMNGAPHWGDGPLVEGTDARYFAYTVQACGGDEGCGLGFWKNHPDAWGDTGYTPDQLVADVFAGVDASLAGATLLDALSFGGGPGVTGAQGILLRQAVAALLNAAHPGVDSPRTVAGLIADVDAAVASGDRPTMLALADALGVENNLGCPLD